MEPGVPCCIRLICRLVGMVEGGLIALGVRGEEAMVEYEMLWPKVSYAIVMDKTDCTESDSDEEEDDRDLQRQETF